MIKLAVLNLPSILLVLYCALCEPLCQLKYSGNTTNLFKHLQTMHPRVYTEHLAVLQYLKYIVILKHRYRNTHTNLGIAQHYL